MGDLEVNLQEFDLGQLVMFLNHSGKTGLLRVDGESKKGRIYLNEGKVVHCEAEDISGVEALYDLSMEDRGRAVFEKGVKAAQQTLEEDTALLTQEFEKRRTEFKELRERLPPLDSVLAKSAAVIPEQGVSLRRMDWQVLALVDGKKPLKEIIGASKLGAFDAYKSIIWLREQGLIVDPREFERLVAREVQRIDIFFDEFARTGVGGERWRVLVEGWAAASEENRMLIESLMITDQTVKLKELKLARLDKDYIKGIFDAFFKFLETEGVGVYGRILAKRKMEAVQKRVAESGK